MITKKDYLEQLLINLLGDLDNPQVNIKEAIVEFGHKIIYISLGDNTYEPLSIKIAQVKMDESRLPELIDWIREELPGGNYISCDIENEKEYIVNYNNFDEISEKSIWVPPILLDKIKEAKDNINQIFNEIKKYQA